ncbi:MAG: aldo/keto reductase, partial [Ectothiorhodospiraceae bacterium]
MTDTDRQRRAFLRRLALAAAGAATLQFLPAAGLPGGTAAARDDIIRRPVPRLDRTIPAIGMGTYITFNVGPDPDLRSRLREVLRIFFAQGGGLIDSSPMYGTSEAV